MRRRHAQGPGTRLEHGFHHRALHARHRRIRGPGQQAPEHLQDGKARDDRVAEFAPLPSRRRTIRGDALHDAVAREQRSERRVLVLARASREVGEVARDLLQAQHVEIGHLSRDPGDARRVDPAIASAAPLDVPGDELHTITGELPLLRACPSAETRKAGKRRPFAAALRRTARQSSSSSRSNRSRFASALPEKFSIPTTITPSAGVAANSGGLIVSGTEARERGPTTANAPVLTALLNALNLPASAAMVPSAFSPRKSKSPVNPSNPWAA